MPTYLVFLRAVNVGDRQYPMAELRAAVEAAGFGDVATHIQTGNLRVSTPKRSVQAVATALEKVFAEDRGFEVPTIVLTPEELVRVAADADEVGHPPPRFAHYVELTREAPSAADRKVIEGADLDDRRMVVRGRAIHQLYDVPYGQAKAPPAAVRRAFGVSTNRNVKVVRALVDKWC